jgi:class 3 adenylate cyclase
MQTTFEQRTDRYLPRGRSVSVEELKKIRVLVFVCFLTSLLAFGFFIFSLVADFQMGVFAMAVSSIVVGSLPFVIRSGANRVVVANVYIGVIFVDTILLTTVSGGLSASITSAYVAIIPMLAVMLVGGHAGTVWFFVVIIETIALGAAELAGVDFPLTFDLEFDAAFKLAAFLGLVIIVFLAAREFDLTNRRAQRQLEEQQQKTQDLLLNILPEDVAEELKATGHAVAREFPQVTVLFCDLKDFTEISSTMTAPDLVEELNTCFNAFDGIMDRYGLEKIKTIGDAYMAAAGLGGADASPVDAIRAALAMQAFMAEHHEENRSAGKPSFLMRTGIHTGPVVAGVVGETKFQYDIWGDTVNTAQRLEASGEAGAVNIGGAIYGLVKDEPGLDFTHRGRVSVKGKGELDMYFVRAGAR